MARYVYVEARRVADGDAFLTSFWHTIVQAGSPELAYKEGFNAASAEMALIGSEPQWAGDAHNGHFSGGFLNDYVVEV